MFLRIFFYYIAIGGIVDAITGFQSDSSAIRESHFENLIRYWSTAFIWRKPRQQKAVGTLFANYNYGREEVGGGLVYRKRFTFFKKKVTKNIFVTFQQ